MYRINKTLIYFLILTLVGSAFAFKIVVTAYSDAYTPYSIQ